MGAAAQAIAARATAGRSSACPARRAARKGSSRNGLAIDGRLANGPGAKAYEAVGTANATTASQPTTRQRGDGSSPSGYSSGRRMRPDPSDSDQTHRSSHATMAVPGSADPAAAGATHAA